MAFGYILGMPAYLQAAAARTIVDHEHHGSKMKKSKT